MKVSQPSTCKDIDSLRYKEICDEEIVSDLEQDILVRVNTPKLEFVLKGSKYEFSNEECVKIDPFNNSGIKLTGSRNIHLTEYSDYEIIIRSKDNSNIEFFHENINIRNKVKPVISGFLSGIINFKGDIGFTDIIVNSDNTPHFKLTLEIYPSKISYKEDYIALIEDVNKEVYNLAYGFLARTYLGSDLNNKKESTYSEFYSILNYVMNKLVKAINIITLHPHHELVKTDQLVKYNNIKKSVPETMRYMMKNPQYVKNINGHYLPERAMVIKKTMTYDTKENRFVKFMIIKISEKIKEFLKRYTKNKLNMGIKSNAKFEGNYDELVINKLINFNKILESKLRSTFLKDVSCEYSDFNLSLVFSMSSGYKEIYKYYLMLQKGLSIKSSIFSLSIKELSLLYEYWCFIKINALLQKKYKLIKSDMIKINKEGITLSLKKGIQSKLVYEDPETSEKFIVFYNAKKTSKTVSQKPDNILSLYKENSITAYEFIFDAKYKIDYSESYLNKHNTPGPKEEDINTMHRYRDAIIYDYKKDDKSNTTSYLHPKEIIQKNKYKNCIFGAFVLFPYNNEEEFKKNTFYKSIEEVNIGAIPFLPSSTLIMEEFLDELIKEEAATTFERALHHIKI